MKKRMKRRKKRKKEEEKKKKKRREARDQDLPWLVSEEMKEFKGG